MANTARIHRVFRAPAERIYRAFVEAEAMVKWMPPHGYTGCVHEMDAEVGGTYRMSFTNFRTGKRHSFGGRYVELVPFERIEYVDAFENPDLPGEIKVTVELKRVLVGTELTLVQEGLPEAIPLEFCYLGWQESCRMLAQLVEAEVPED